MRNGSNAFRIGMLLVSVAVWRIGPGFILRWVFGWAVAAAKLVGALAVVCFTLAFGCNCYFGWIDRKKEAERKALVDTAFSKVVAKANSRMKFSTAKTNQVEAEELVLCAWLLASDRSGAIERQFRDDLCDIVLEYHSEWKRAWCYHCFKTNDSADLFFCTRCKTAKYCSLECYKLNRPYHGECFDGSKVDEMRKCIRKQGMREAVDYLRCESESPLSGLRLEFLRDAVFKRERWYSEFQENIHYLFRRRTEVTVDEWWLLLRRFWASPFVPEIMLSEDMVTKAHRRYEKAIGRGLVSAKAKDKVMNALLDFGSMYCWMYFWANAMCVTVCDDQIEETKNPYTNPYLAYSRGTQGTGTNFEHLDKALTGKSKHFCKNLVRICNAEICKMYCEPTVMFCTVEAASPLHCVVSKYIICTADSNGDMVAEAGMSVESIKKLAVLLKDGILNTLLNEMCRGDQSLARASAASISLMALMLCPLSVYASVGGLKWSRTQWALEMHRLRLHFRVFTFDTREHSKELFSQVMSTFVTAGVWLAATEPDENGKHLQVFELNKLPPDDFWSRCGQLLFDKYMESFRILSEMRIPQHYVSPFAHFGVNKHDVACAKWVLGFFAENPFIGPNEMKPEALERRAKEAFAEHWQTDCWQKVFHRNFHVLTMWVCLVNAYYAKHCCKRHCRSYA